MAHQNKCSWCQRFLSRQASSLSGVLAKSGGCCGLSYRVLVLPDSLPTYVCQNPRHQCVDEPPLVVPRETVPGAHRRRAPSASKRFCGFGLVRAYTPAYENAIEAHALVICFVFLLVIALYIGWVAVGHRPRCAPLCFWVPPAEPGQTHVVVIILGVARRNPRQNQAAACAVCAVVRLLGGQGLGLGFGLWLPFGAFGFGSGFALSFAGFLGSVFGFPWVV